MKRIMSIIFAAGVVLCSCSKDIDSPVSEQRMPSDGEICFMLAGEDIGFEIATKATPVTSVSTVYWQCLNGSTSVYDPASYSVASGTGLVSTSKYWPYNGATYNYRVANVSFTSAGVIAASNTTDVVVGTASSVTSNSCTVNLDHIFARTGTLTLNAPSTYSISGISWQIKSTTSGQTGKSGNYTIGTGWATSGNTPLGTSNDYTAFTGSSDLWLIPGSYTVKVTYTLTKGAYTHEFTAEGPVTLQMGKVNNISATAPTPVPGAQEITFNVAVTAWGTNNISSITWNN